MAQKSILDFMKRKPTTPNLKGDNKNGSNVAVKRNGIQSAGQNGINDTKEVEEKSTNSTNNGEIDELAKSCLEVVKYRIKNCGIFLLKIYSLRTLTT